MANNGQVWSCLGSFPKQVLNKFQSHWMKIWTYNLCILTYNSSNDLFYTIFQIDHEGRDGFEFDSCLGNIHLCYTDIFRNPSIDGDE